MNFFKNRYVLKVFSLIGLSIILLNILNISLYTHSHVLADGEIITHAHPFDGSNDPLNSHEHTSLEYLVLSVFDNAIIAVFVFTLLTLPPINSFKFKFLKRIYKQLFFHFKKNKSPPFTYSY